MILIADGALRLLLADPDHAVARLADRALTPRSGNRAVDRLRANARLRCAQLLAGRAPIARR